MSLNEFTGDVYSVLILEKNVCIGLARSIANELRSIHSAEAPGYKLLFHIARSLQELRNHGPKVRVDFVVVAMDARDTSCLIWAHEVLSELPATLHLRRTVLVCAAGNTDCADIGHKFHVDVMFADVREPRLCRFLASRLKIYMEDSFGCCTGFPNFQSCAHQNAKMTKFNFNLESSENDLDASMEST